MEDGLDLIGLPRHRRTGRPLMVAWMLVIVILAAGFIWLTLTADEMEHGGELSLDKPTDQVDDQPDDQPDDQEDPDHPVAPVPKSGTESSPPVTQTQAAANQTPAASEVPDDPVTENNDSAERLVLARAPIEGLVMEGANGPLPVLGPDGLVAWKEYARPEDVSDDRPKIAIVITGIGLNSKSTDIAIKQLPGQVNLAFSPYGRNLQQWMNKSRAFGHEGFLMIPTEPLQYPEYDPGPHTLLTNATLRDNLKKLDWLLSQVTGYVGVVNEMGSKFTTSEEAVLPILTDLKDRGLMFLDSRSTRYSVAANLARQISMPISLTNATLRDNLKKLDWLLSQVTGYVGVVNEMGSKFTTSEEAVLPILTDLKDRGLMFLDSRSTRYSVAANLARQISMPRAFNNLYIDNTLSQTEIVQSLRKLENTARTFGIAIGVGRAFPLTIREIEKWTRELEQRGFQLVPVTAIANRQPIR